MVTRVELTPGYSISRLIKGGWQLAGGHGPIETGDAIADMDRFADAGITTFDCADIYTGVEALIGRWRRMRRGAGAMQVHTKYVPDMDRLPTHSRADVIGGIDRSLSRLGVERLDLVQLHWWDYEVQGYVDATLWLGELQRAGKIRHIGLTNFDHARVAEIAAAGVTVISHQVQYSVIDRRPAAAMTSTCAQLGVGLLCYGALAGGFLSERWLGVPAPSRATREPLARQIPADRRGVRRLGAVPGAARGAARHRRAPRCGHRRRGDSLGARSAWSCRRDRGRTTRAASGSTTRRRLADAG